MSKRSSIGGYNVIYTKSGNIDGRCQYAKAMNSGCSDTSSYFGSHPNAKHFEPSPIFEPPKPVAPISSNNCKKPENTGNTSSSKDIESLNKIYTKSGEIDKRCEYYRAIKSQVPEKVDSSKQFRQLSDTKCRSANKKGDATYDDQQRCHRIPNEVLADVYNQTDDAIVKEQLLSFACSTDNMFNSTHNEDHSRMERGFMNGEISQSDFNQKSSIMETGLKNLMNSEHKDYSSKTVATILSCMSNMSPDYKDFVANLDKRVFRDPQVKEVIDSARQ